MNPSRHSRGKFIALLATAPWLRLSGAETAFAPKENASPDRIPGVPGDGPIRIALIADCQFADIESKPEGVRQFLHSPQKLADAVAALSAEKPHFAIHLGDLIDRDFRSFAAVKPVFDQFACPRFHVAGNHDFYVADAEKAKVYELLEIPAPGWRDLTVPGWRFIFLDSNAVSLTSRAKDSPETLAATAEYRRFQQSERGKYARDWNGALGPVQRAWLRSRLELAAERQERAIIFCHQPTNDDDEHSLWDAPETLAIIAAFPGVAAWINGHYHTGSYRRIGATHFLNIKGMVDTRENTFALATLHPDRIEIRGYGREPSRTLRFEA